MAWVYLCIAICFEVLGTTFMKLSDGFSHVYYATGMFVSYFVCFVFLSLSLKTIDMGVAYAMWAALGIVLVTTVGVLCFGEHMNLVKVVSTLFIIAGVVGLKLSSGH